MQCADVGCFVALQEGLVDVKVTEGDKQNGPQYHRNQPSKGFGKIVDHVNQIVLRICTIMEMPVPEWDRPGAHNSSNNCNRLCVL